MSNVDVEALGLDQSCIIEGTVEEDPVSGYCTVRTEQDGKPVSFDPQTVLKQMAGTDVRVVVVPLATIVQLTEMTKRLQDASVEVVDDPSSGD